MSLPPIFMYRRSVLGGGRAKLTSCPGLVMKYVREREREGWRDRERKGDRGREGEREGGGMEREEGR